MKKMTTKLETTELSFLKIKAVRLDCKESLPENKTKHKNGSLGKEEDLSGSILDETKSNEQQRACEILSGETFWRVPKQTQLAHVKYKPTIMSPVATSALTQSPSFPKLVPLEKDSIMANGIFKEKKRSTSAPGCSYAHTKIRKNQFRLPDIPDLQSLSIKDNHEMKSFVVKGKKLGSTGSFGVLSSPGLRDKGNGFSNSESKVISKNPSRAQTAETRVEKSNNKTEGGKERCLGEACEDQSFPLIKKTKLRVKTAYANSSRIFNTYLQSRFGKSVFMSNDKKTDMGAGNKYQIYWAPVLINKKVLYNRTDAADSTQESREDVRTTKERKVHYETIGSSSNDADNGN